MAEGDLHALGQFSQASDHDVLSILEVAVGQESQTASTVGQVAADAASIGQSDVDRLRELGLSDGDVADVVFAAAARCFFTRVLDGLGAQLDVQTAATFAPAILESLAVGRPAAER